MVAPSLVQKSRQACVSEQRRGFVMVLTPLEKSAISNAWMVWLFDAGMSTWPHTEPGKSTVFITPQF